MALILAALTGTWGTHTYPVWTDDVFVGMTAAETPNVYRMLAYGYATSWFVTPYLAASLSCHSWQSLSIDARQATASGRCRPAPIPRRARS